MGGARLSFVGQTHDNRGAGQVEVCLRPEGEHSDDDCAWANVQLEGGQDGRWIRIVTNLEGQDNVTHTLRAYAVDLVGNRSQELTGLSARSGNRPLTRTFDNSASGLTFQLDNVAPVITVTAAITQLEAFPDRPLTTVLSGTVTDGGQVNRLYALVRTPGGDLLTGQIARNDSGGGWWYDLRPSAIGEYAIWVNAVDGADNAATFGPHYLQVTCRSADLTATIVNAETAVGASSPISFTARVSNNGGDEVPAGLPVAFYANDSLIGTAVTTRALNTGESEELTVIWAVDTPGDYEITIVVNDDGAGARPVALCSAPSETQQTISILDVPLGERWNLVSSYVNPSNTDTEAVQRPISGTYVTIQSFDQGARSYYPDLPPGFNNLTDMDAEHGYWIKARDGISPTLRIVGQAFAEDRPLGLDAGWNLVSYLPRASKLVTEALQSIAGKYTVVLGFDRGALSFYPDLPPEINTLRTLDPLYGYWIKTTQTVTLQYSTTVEVGSWKLEVGEGTRLQSPISNLQSPISNTRQVERAAGVSPTNTWVNFYGPARQSDDTLLPVGTMVLAVDPGGVTCGAAAVIYEGQYGLLACYGDDPDTPADEGGRRGDAIRLMVAGKVLGAGVWTAYGERQRISLGKDDRQYRFLPLLPYGDRSPAGNEQGPAAPPARRWLPLIPQGTGSTGGAITPSGNRTFYLPLAPWRVPADDGRESRIEPLPAWRAVLSRLWDGIQRRFAVLPANSVPAPVAMR
ncbi:MAG: hypothetical protein NT169_08650 [Chloroflexi bacterium]|nr:hypothetical protein [Chloroflexota bacterium]